MQPALQPIFNDTHRIIRQSSFGQLQQVAENKIHELELTKAKENIGLQS